ncbi:MAG: MaoC family dehydratase [Bacteroidota bacterium]
MIIIQGIAGLKEYLGKEIGVSDWLTITQERINEFAHATGDHQWIHTDPARATAELPYKNTIAHGFLTLSLAPHFLHEIYQVEGIKMAINYGLNNVRFTAPVVTNSLLRMRASLIEIENKAGGCKTTSRLTFEVEGKNKPVCLADTLTVFYA